MVIGFDGSRAFEGQRTGTENYSYQLLKNLSRIDAENIYCVYIRQNSEIADFSDWPKNFRFIKISFPRLWTQVGLALQTFINKLDLLFVPSHTLPLLKRPGLKTIMTVHDLGSEYLPGMHQLKQTIYLKLITRFQLKSATKLIAVSNTTKDDVVRKVGLNPSKIEVIYEGVDRKVFNPIKNDTLINSLRYYNLQAKTYFLFVGTIQPRKNLRRLIEAFSQFSEQYNSIPLVLIGSKGWMSDDIYRLPKKLGIEDRVKFLGHIPGHDLPSLYSGAIALVFPSLFEGFGLPILEAFSCGCPVITSNCSSMPEVAGGAAILVDPNNLEEISQAMQKIAKNDKLRDSLIQKGFKQVKKFSWEKCARQTLNLLTQL